MSELTKAIETLERLKSSLQGKHRVYTRSLSYAGVDLSEEIGETEEVMQLLRNSLQQIQRLQNLQTKEVTPEELESCNDEAVGWMVYSHTIAAVCRGMLREGNGDG